MSIQPEQDTALTAPKPLTGTIAIMINQLLELDRVLQQQGNLPANVNFPQNVDHLAQMISAAVEPLIKAYLDTLPNPKWHKPLAVNKALYHPVIRAVEGILISQVIEKLDNNHQRTAAALGISPVTLRNRLESLDLVIRKEYVAREEA